MAASASPPPLASLHFPHLLASNSAVERNGALRRLRRFLAAKSQQRDKGGLNFEDLLKLWKGLFYCLWSQDKPLIQEELCDNLSSLLHCLHGEDLQFLFAAAFWVTLSREWSGIDRQRLDKFYMLIRRFLRQMLIMLKMRNWEMSLLERVCASLDSVLRSPSLAPPPAPPPAPPLPPPLAPPGLRFHVSEVFLEELAGVGAAELSPQQCQRLLRPFITSAASTSE
ncbi:ribosomal RNA processing protein 1 homolog A-like [Petromyzon marinus]|uniref:ribosomal RNA processing protein 1 homolog A-like n=1 Tax=Petromyzon marinus TaxID=7757 RepID=UPI003F708F4C